VRIEGSLRHRWKPCRPDLLKTGTCFQGDPAVAVNNKWDQYAAMDARVHRLAEAIQSEVFHARVDGLLGSLNDDLSKERLKPFLQRKMFEHGHPILERKLTVIVEHFPIIDIDPDDGLAGIAARSENEAKNIAYLLAWALPELGTPR
jgi:hypothetical protein